MTPDSRVGSISGVALLGENQLAVPTTQMIRISLVLDWFNFYSIFIFLFRFSLFGNARKNSHFAWVDQPLCLYAWALNGK
jgi:hypothetical protein